MQPSRADVFGSRVYLVSAERNLMNGAVGEYEVNSIRGEERLILFEERIPGLGQDAVEIVFPEAIQLHPYGEPALEFRNEVRGV